MKMYIPNFKYGNDYTFCSTVSLSGGEMHGDMLAAVCFHLNPLKTILCLVSYIARKLS